MAIILFEEQSQREKFYPLTFTKPFAELHFGIFSVREWWENFTGQKVHLFEEADTFEREKEHTVFINSHLLPNENIWQEIQNLKSGESLKDNRGNTLARQSVSENEKTVFVKEHLTFCFIEYPYELIRHHAAIIEQQFQWIRRTKTSQKISSSNNVINEENIFIEENAEAEYATLNAKEGPIYIGKKATVMEGALIRGAFALGENATVKMGAKIYGAVSAGRKCTLGGEIKNTIFNHGSNKAHDGYLGDSIIGSWCNFGAGATNSNVKNTASEVGVYDYHSGQLISTQSKKFGVLTGDYSRVSINSSINTGSSIGVCCNVFGEVLLPKFIPNFSWGINNKDKQYAFDKAIEHIRNWMAFKNEQPTEKEIQTLRHIFENSNAR